VGGGLNADAVIRRRNLVINRMQMESELIDPVILSVVCCLDRILCVLLRYIFGQQKDDNR
jgi:hypothetical protein